MKARITTRVISMAALTLLSGAVLSADDAQNQNKQADSKAARAQLGKALFFDTQLSEPAGQSCASCHQPAHAFADPGKTVSPGANPARFGNRNTPSISYVQFNPEPSWNIEDETWIGGFFLDGRAKTLHEQVLGPLMNPLEMGNPDTSTLAQKIRQRPYINDLIALYSLPPSANNDSIIAATVDAVTHFETSNEFAPFSSKYDTYLRGETQLSAQEMRGLKLFEDEKKGNCAACHPSQRGKQGEMPLFTDFSYDNIGVPTNKKNHPQHDVGLAKTSYANKQDENGKFKVQSLRNIARTAPYMHNGVFTELREAVEFYNTRDTDKKWGKSDVEANVNKEELGDLKLKDKEIDDIVAFLKTLDDGYTTPSTKTE